MANDPNWNLPEVPSFTLTSPDFTDGGELPTSARGTDAGGEDRSPALEWSGAPEGTKSFVLTVYDPDAPTGSGFWHWSLTDIPGSATSLPAGAGTDDALLPAEALRRRNEFGTDTFLGAAPPAGRAFGRTTKYGTRVPSFDRASNCSTTAPVASKRGGAALTCSRTPSARSASHNVSGIR